MAAQPTSFSPEEFYTRLQQDDLTPALTLSGMVKQSDEAGEVFEFSIAGCEEWVTVPLNAIANVDVTGSLPCRDHSHPVASIEFKRPADADVWMFELLRSATDATRSIAARLMYLDRTTLGEGTGAVPTPCTQCIRDCGHSHVGDPIGYMLCALDCPCGH